MRSPFPGMDPYIESCGLWEDFHQNLMGEVYGSVARAVPERYVVRFGERSYVILVVEAEFRESFVEISLVRPERCLVTTIEVLSPSNKRFDSDGWHRYARKRQAHLEGKANLVEIDLLRGGLRMPMETDWPASPYYVLVCRTAEAPSCTVWPAFFHRPRPKLLVPLAPPDEDIILPLQPMVDAVYERSRYRVDISYHQPCRPPLDPSEVEWLQQRLCATAFD